VDRKALNYHVSDRDGLLELVALDVLHTEMSRFSDVVSILVVICGQADPAERTLPVNRP
jgi:hypothetical protein